MLEDRSRALQASREQHEQSQASADRERGRVEGLLAEAKAAHAAAVADTAALREESMQLGAHLEAEKAKHLAKRKAERPSESCVKKAKKDGAKQGATEHAAGAAEHSLTGNMGQQFRGNRVL